MKDVQINQIRCALEIKLLDYWIIIANIYRLI